MEMKGPVMAGLITTLLNRKNWRNILMLLAEKTGYGSGQRGDSSLYTLRKVPLLNLRMLDNEDASNDLGITLKDNIDFVAFESETVLTNAGDETWNKETGMPSIWILGMFTPSPGVTIIIPYKMGDEALYGSIVNDTYFGKIPQ